jgi:hypothetical protein
MGAKILFGKSCATEVNVDIDVLGDFGLVFLFKKK